VLFGGGGGVTRRFSFALAAAGLLGVPEASAAEPSFTGLGDLPGGSIRSEGYAVSAGGTAAAGLSTGSTTSSGVEAFRWTAGGGIVGVGKLVPTASLSFGQGISADGSVVVGWENQSQSLIRRAFRWTLSGGMADLGDLPGGASHANASAVSDDGSVVVGGSSSGSSGNDQTEAFLWTAAGGMVGLGDFPGGDPISGFDSFAFGVSGDGLVVVGEGISGATGREAFRWTASGGMVGIGDLPTGGFESSARSASFDGSVVVGIGRSELGAFEAFRWTAGGGMVGLGDLPGGHFWSEANDVSADGSVVVGNSWTTSGTSGIRPFIWDAENGMQSLDAVLTSLGLNLTGWSLRSATGISADGRTIVGTGINPAGNTEAYLAYLGAVPDPPAPPPVPAMSPVGRGVVALMLAAAVTALGRVLFRPA
jgi:probable HAF family extracellular repeat protein